MRLRWLVANVAILQPHSVIGFRGGRRCERVFLGAPGVLTSQAASRDARYATRPCDRDIFSFSRAPFDRSCVRRALSDFVSRNPRGFSLR
jgi:hypothetical protein